MSKPSTPGHVASTNSNAAKIIHVMTHCASAVSAPHPVYRFAVSVPQGGYNNTHAAFNVPTSQNSFYFSAATEHLRIRML